VDNQEISYHCWGSNGGGGIIHIAGVTIQPGDSAIARGPITLPQVPQSSHVVTDGLRMSMDELSPLPLVKGTCVALLSPTCTGPLGRVKSSPLYLLSRRQRERPLLSPMTCTPD
jgi:hypothetical protein